MNAKTKNRDKEYEQILMVLRDSKTPLYHQIFLILRGKILDNTYPPRSLVPNEKQIMEMYDVSRITAKRALNELADAKYVVRERGKGTRVRDQLPDAPLEIQSDDLIESMYQMGLQTEAEVLEFSYIKAPSHIAIHLNCDTGDIVQMAVRVRSYKGKPFSYIVSYVPEATGNNYSREDLNKTPLFQLIERQGIKLTRAQHSVNAVLADPTVAPLLGVDIGSPLLSVNKLIFDQDDKPVEYLADLYRPDRYNYKVNLAVSDEGQTPEEAG
ncbi:MAG: GntR family transcriptional regulator [Rhodospirillales bacterium]|jgi:GntR family transcriptional regulator|nr:GntR family transcriptional regulator [Rhodospirillales bacterium]